MTTHSTERSPHDGRWIAMVLIVATLAFSSWACSIALTQRVAGQAGTQPDVAVIAPR